jgi:amidase
MDRREFLGGVSALGLAMAIDQSAANAAALPSDITAMSASTLSQAIKQRQVTCVEVMQAYLGRVHRYNPVYNAIVSMVDDDELLRQATLADVALDRDKYWGWMHGMPHAPKNLANAKGLETSHGSPIFAGTIATQDDLHIARIRAEGAIFIGKTNTPEFGLGSQSYNPVHGTVRNAYNPALTAGGSSGGAACGLAAHMLPAADGSDMMGSLRNPGAFNNVIGFRPSQGRVPSVPAGDVFYNQLATDGPMGRSVEDTIRLLITMSGYDSRAPLSLRDQVPPYDEFRSEDLEGFRIGWMGDYEGYLEMEEGVLDSCEASLKTLSDNGAIVENCMPDFSMDRLWQTWLTLRHWSLGNSRDLYDDPDMRKLLKPEMVWEIEGSFDMPAARVTEAASARSDWYRALHEQFKHYDVLALPTAQVFPFSADVHWPKAINDRSMDTYHRWMEVVIGGTLSGLPVVNLPAGFDASGRPMGMQFFGRMGHDRKLLEFALAYESVTTHLERRPELVDSFQT